MIDANTRGNWGGIWTANGNYSFIHNDNTQTDITLTTKFDNWDYNDTGIEERMPWYSTSGGQAILTTSSSTDEQWWGTLIARDNAWSFVAPWIGTDNLMPNPAVIWYWVR